MRNFLVGLFAFFSPSLLLSCASQAQAPELCPADADLARLVAASSTIAVGTIEIDKATFNAEASNEDPSYVDLQLATERLLKGPSTSQRLMHYPRDATYNPGNAAIIAAIEQPMLFFLVSADAGTPALYFAGDTPNALRPADAESIAITQAEIIRQLSLLEEWEVDEELPHFYEAQELIDQLSVVKASDETRIFARLEALGPSAVPAIVALMDDRRPLRGRSINLRNFSPDAFEGMRHYGPQQVVDALAAILTQLSNQNFGNIENGGTAAVRDQVVAGWRVYAHDLSCD